MGALPGVPSGSRPAVNGGVIAASSAHLWRRAQPACGWRPAVCIAQPATCACAWLPGLRTSAVFTRASKQPAHPHISRPPCFHCPCRPGPADGGHVHPVPCQVGVLLAMLLVIAFILVLAATPCGRTEAGDGLLSTCLVGGSGRHAGTERSPAPGTSFTHPADPLSALPAGCAISATSRRSACRQLACRWAAALGWARGGGSAHAAREVAVPAGLPRTPSAAAIVCCTRLACPPALQPSSMRLFPLLFATQYWFDGPVEGAPLFADYNPEQVGRHAPVGQAASPSMLAKAFASSMAGPSVLQLVDSNASRAPLWPVPLQFFMVQCEWATTGGCRWHRKPRVRHPLGRQRSSSWCSHAPLPACLSARPSNWISQFVPQPQAATAWA